jgi:predicted permease
VPGVSRISSLWRNLTQRRRVERDLDDEVRAAFDLLVDERVRGGMPADDARRVASLELGGVEGLKEQVREARAGALVDSCLQDIRYALRLLRRNLIFSITASLSLAIGIGATTTIFTVANGLLLRAPAGVVQPDRLVDLFHTEDGNRLVEPLAPYTDYLEVRRRITMLDGVYAYQLDLSPVSLRAPGNDGAERIFGGVVTANYFSVLGVSAAAGRLFGVVDSDEPDASPVVVLSHRFWRQRFNADPAIVGQTLQLNGRPFTIVGVARDGFSGTSVVAADLWAPAGMASAFNTGMRLDVLMVMLGARLKPGIFPAQAAAEVDAIGRAISRERPRVKEINGRVVETGGESFGLVAASPIPGNLRPLIAGFLVLLMGLVSIVLVIACANVAGVLLARAAARRREIAVRLAIGAGRARLIRQLLTETVVLFVFGAAAGLVLARGMTSLLLTLLPAFPLPVAVSLPLDGRVLAFSIGLSLVAALLSGLTPALQSSKTEVVSALKADSQGPSDRLRLRSAFVVAQVAFSLLLVVVAGLLVQAQGRVTSTDQGFDPRGVEVASVDLAMAGYTDVTGPTFARDLVDRVRQIPGVQAATLADRVPDSRVLFNGGLTVPGVQPPNGRSFFAANWSVVEPGYFATLRTPLVAGRDFTRDDRAGSQPVVILGEATARRFWPGQDPLGKYVVWEGGLVPTVRPGLPPPERRLLVVGIARDMRYDSAGGDVRPLVAYVPLPQRYASQVTILARTTHGQRIAGEIRALVAAMNPNLPMISAQTLENAQAGPVETQLRVAAWVSGSVGLVGVLLAAIGIYGVTAYAVTRRTREIGIRLALGARRADIVALVLRQGMFLVAVGSILGLMLAAAAPRLLRTLLFGMRPLDLLTFGGAVVLFAAIGMLACYLPTRRAVRTDAMDALRYE